MGRVGGPGGSRDPRLRDNSSRTTTYATIANAVHFAAVNTSSGCERRGISNVAEAIVTENGGERVCGAKACLKGAVCGDVLAENHCWLQNGADYIHSRLRSRRKRDAMFI